MKSSIPISYHHNWKHRYTVGYYVNYSVAFSQLKAIPEIHNPLYHLGWKIPASVAVCVSFQGVFL